MSVENYPYLAQLSKGVEVTPHVWVPGEVCVAPIHEWVRGGDAFLAGVEHCVWCIALRHVEWWNNDIIVRRISNEYPYLEDPDGELRTFEVRAR